MLQCFVTVCVWVRVCVCSPPGWSYLRMLSSTCWAGWRFKGQIIISMQRRTHVFWCCFYFILFGSDGFNPEICWFISPIDRFIVPLWSMHLALLTPAFLLSPSFYQTLFAPSVPSFLSDLPLLSLSLPPHTHSLSLLSPSVPPSLCFLVSLFFFYFLSLPHALIPSPSPSHSPDWFWHLSPLISEHTHS